MKTTALIIKKAEPSRTVLPANKAVEEERFETELDFTANAYLTKGLMERMNAPLKLSSGRFFREFGINE